MFSYPRSAAAFLVPIAMAGTLNAASMTVTFTPPTASTSTAVAATIAYSGVTAVGNGTQVVACYDATKLTFVSATYANPPGENTSAQDQAAGALCVAPATRQVSLNWTSVSASWPSNPAGSGTLAPSGTLATINFTTAATFTGSTALVATENTALGSNYTLGTATGSVSLLVPATAATFTASPTSLTFAEGGAAQNVAVTCAGTIGTPSPVVINVASSNTAAFTVGSASLSFTTCPSSQNVAVTPRAADAGSNPTQTGNVTFSTATTGATAPASVGVTVTDNQAPAVYSVTKSTATVTEGNAATDTLTVTCTGAFTGGLTSGSVQYAITGLTNPGDIAAPALTGALNFAACGGATQSVTISPRANDAIVQGNRSGTFTISTPVAGTLGTATGTINVNDDDTPQTVTVAVTNSPATEAGGVLTYTFTRAGGNAAAVAATLAVNVTPPATSARYSTTCASTVTFAANATTATCTATGIDNTAVDGNVNVVVAVAAPTVAGSYTVGTPSSATGVIADDDFGVSVAAVSGVVTEGQSAVFTISCNGATGSYTANYTITGRDTGSTVTPSATSAPLNCATATSTATVTVTTIDDIIQGNNRAVTLTLNSVVASGPAPAAVIVGTPAAATVTVLDNDAPTIIPTISAFGLGLMSLLLAGFAAFQTRRRTLK
jgi:IPTL-CTERM motif